MKNPQLRFKEWLTEVEHPELAATVHYPGRPYDLSETPWAIRRRPPLRGEHTEEVLAEIGIDSEQVAALRSAGVV